MNMVPVVSDNVAFVGYDLPLDSLALADRINTIDKYVESRTLSATDMAQRASGSRGSSARARSASANPASPLPS